MRQNREIGLTRCRVVFNFWPPDLKPAPTSDCRSSEDALGDVASTMPHQRGYARSARRVPLKESLGCSRAVGLAQTDTVHNRRISELALTPASSQRQFAFALLHHEMLPWNRSTLTPANYSTYSKISLGFEALQQDHRVPASLGVKH